MEGDRFETPHTRGDEEDELAASITADVMKCLARCMFFEELDDRLCPSDSTKASENCGGNFEISKSILRSHGFDEAEMTDIFSVMRAQGGFCDCEVLYNVVESSRLKAAYWRTRAKGQEPRTAHGSAESARE